MAKKTLIDLSKDDDVTAGSTDVTVHPSAIPNLKVARITRFGGATPLDTDGVQCLTILQWGSGSTWKTVRAFSRSTIEYAMDKEFEGDGTKTFRLVRVNRTGTTKPMIAWVEGLII